MLAEIARGLARADYALVIVAEGYEAERRKLHPDKPSASTFFRQQLAAAGLTDSADKRVIAEPFSRYIRGVRPAFLDVSAAYLKASLLFDAFEQGRTEIMPFVLAAHDVGVRPFADIHREDGSSRRSCRPRSPGTTGVPAVDPRELHHRRPDSVELSGRAVKSEQPRA